VPYYTSTVADPEKTTNENKFKFSLSSSDVSAMDRPTPFTLTVLPESMTSRPIPDIEDELFQDKLADRWTVPRIVSAEFVKEMVAVEELNTPLNTKYDAERIHTFPEYGIIQNNLPGAC